MRFIGVIILLFLCGCRGLNASSSGNSQPIVIEECAGFVSVKLNLRSAPPSKLRIDWNGDTQVNECTGQNRAPVERGSDWIRYSDGGFGYTAPETLSLEVYDLGDCSTGESLLFSVAEAPVSAHPPQLCEPFELEFNE